MFGIHFQRGLVPLPPILAEPDLIVAREEGRELSLDADGAACHQRFLLTTYTVMRNFGRGTSP